VKDNVASLLLSGEQVVADVYATCVLAEQPTDPMLIESVPHTGCMDLKFPLQGHIALRKMPDEQTEL